ncbi:unnamed protein product [Pleuronectes platessa]|uniref:Uncharacterized protein n=1 Tax=Pleuronectes platessa TaxID=8262 RepID=A0A9N7V1R7_PLEPL|nr:unnamed protein product [Pleuronectes platessa]
MEPDSAETKAPLSSQSPQTPALADQLYAAVLSHDATPVPSGVIHVHLQNHDYLLPRASCHLPITSLDHPLLVTALDGMPLGKVLISIGLWELWSSRVQRANLLVSSLELCPRFLSLLLSGRQSIYYTGDPGSLQDVPSSSSSSSLCPSSSVASWSLPGEKLVLQLLQTSSHPSQTPGIAALPLASRAVSPIGVLVTLRLATLN